MKKINSVLIRGLVIAAGLGLSGSVFAATVNFTCGPKVFGCSGPPMPGGNGGCQWRYLGGSTYTLPMSPAPLPPNPGSKSAWSAVYRDAIDGHYLTVEMLYDGKMTLSGTLNAQTVIAESSGVDWMDLSVRNQNYGRGFVCSGFKVTP